jgi:hypothetical protein
MEGPSHWWKRGLQIGNREQEPAIRSVAYSVSTKHERVAACERLARDYQPQFDAIDGGVNPWANATAVGVEILFGKSRQPAWDTFARYAKRRWPFGRVEEYRRIEDAELDVRSCLDAFLEEQRIRRMHN